MLQQNDMRLHITDEAIKVICEEGFDPQFGARPVKRVIQKKVMNELSKQLLAGKVSKDTMIVLDAIDKQIVFRKPINEKEEAISFG
jgi:ATP-dependent Clp protease ATP-binding subunit ClpB